jgi:hypothetical protein
MDGFLGNQANRELAVKIPTGTETRFAVPRQPQIGFKSASSKCIDLHVQRQQMPLRSLDSYFLCYTERGTHD